MVQGRCVYVSVAQMQQSTIDSRIKRIGHQLRQALPFNVFICMDIDMEYFSGIGYVSSQSFFIFLAGTNSRKYNN